MSCILIECRPDLFIQVREIQQEGYREPEMVVQRQAPKKTAAADLSKRLQDLRALNDANSKKGDNLLFSWTICSLVTFLFLVLFVRLLALHDITIQMNSHTPQNGSFDSVLFYNICMLEGEKCSVMNLS